MLPPQPIKLLIFFFQHYFYLGSLRLFFLQLLDFFRVANIRYSFAERSDLLRWRACGNACCEFHCSSPGWWFLRSFNLLFAQVIIIIVISQCIVIYNCFYLFDGCSCCGQVLTIILLRWRACGNACCEFQCSSPGWWFLHGFNLLFAQVITIIII